MNVLKKLKKKKWEKDSGNGDGVNPAPPPKSPYPVNDGPSQSSSASDAGGDKKKERKKRDVKSEHNSSGRHRSGPADAGGERESKKEHKKERKHKSKDKRSSKSKLESSHASLDAIEDSEPKMPVAVGMRRKAAVDIQGLGDSLSVADLKDGDGDSDDKNRRGKMSRRSSAKNVKLGESDVSVVGNWMNNIHSSPVEATPHYEAPVYPKTDAEADFISVALQRNFIFANALSDEDTIRKREMRQIVDAFERHEVAEPGTIILSASEVGDCFYILKEGCVEYRGLNPNTGKQEVVGRAKRPGQSFGELCLLYDCPPPADCLSAGAKAKDGSYVCVLWRLNKLAFRQIMASRTMLRDESVRDSLRKIEHFQGLDDEFVNRIANALDVRTIKRGEVIYQQGDSADAVFVVGSEGKVMVGSKVLGSGEPFGEEAIVGDAPLRRETATAERRTTLLTISREHLARTVGSLADAIQLSKDRRLLKSIALFRDSDFEDFEYELLAALIETVTYAGGKILFEEEELITEPALMIVREGMLDQFSDRIPEREKVLREGDTFAEYSLMPDKNMKFGGAKGGTKYYEETVEVISDTVVCGKLTLANIDSVILDLHRLGCKKRSKSSRRKTSVQEEDPPETLDELEFHKLFGAGTFGRVWIVSKLPQGKTAYALKIQSKRELLDQRQASSARRERAVMSRLDHPFVCKLAATFQDDACIYMLLSLIQGGELLNLIQGGEMHGGLPEIATKFYAAGILEGLTYMHRRHIVYRDLKPENVLLDRDGYAVIVDFGFCELCAFLISLGGPGGDVCGGLESIGLTLFDHSLLTLFDALYNPISSQSCDGQNIYILWNTALPCTRDCS